MFRLRQGPVSQKAKKPVMVFMNKVIIVEKNLRKISASKKGFWHKTKKIKLMKAFQKLMF